MTFDYSCDRHPGQPRLIRFALWVKWNVPNLCRWREVSINLWFFRFGFGVRVPPFFWNQLWMWAWWKVENWHREREESAE